MSHHPLVFPDLDDHLAESVITADGATELWQLYDPAPEGDRLEETGWLCVVTDHDGTVIHTEACIGPHAERLARAVHDVYAAIFTDDTTSPHLARLARVLDALPDDEEEDGE